MSLEMVPAEPKLYSYTSWRGRKSMGTYGSRSVMMYFDQMRHAGAQARKMLLNAAAKEWGVDPNTLTTEPHSVVHAASKRRLSYGEIAAFADAPDTMPKVAERYLKKRSRFRAATFRPR